MGIPAGLGQEGMILHRDLIYDVFQKIRAVILIVSKNFYYIHKATSMASAVGIFFLGFELQKLA